MQKLGNNSKDEGKEYHRSLMKIGTDNVLFINYLCISKRLICEFRNVNVKRDESNWVEHDYRFALPMEIILHTS